MLQDLHHRVHDYLRISLTDQCNMRCHYCIPDEHHSFAPNGHLMQPDEIHAIARIFADLGVNKIRLTGGEPLMRKDFSQILASLYPMFKITTLTTNGVLLDRYLAEILDAGVTSINISLDTLDRQKFFEITKRDMFDRVYQNILSCVQSGLHVKINMVCVKGLNDDEILKFVQWTKDLPIHLRFIEFMPFDGNQWDQIKVITQAEILTLIETQFEMTKSKDEQHATAKGYQVFGHLGTVSLITTMTNHFCGTCNRLRLTADGKMKNCLFSQTETDLLTAFRSGVDIVPLIHQNLLKKAPALGGQMDVNFQKINATHLVNRSMISIGG